MAPSWSDLPLELLGLIILHLSCLADRVYFAAVCRSWQASSTAARALAPPLHLPWLVLPSADAPSFVSILSGSTRRLCLPEGARGARLCGSHDGGWFALAANGWRGYALANLFSGAWIPLPERLRFPPSARGLGGHLGYESCVIVRAIALSAAPTSQICLAAAIVLGTSNLAFLRPGLDQHWLDFGTIQGLQDILYYEGEVLQGFHTINNHEVVTVFKQDCAPAAALKMAQTPYRMQRRPDTPSYPNVSRYLVESRGKLLMVVRYFPLAASAEPGSSAAMAARQTCGFDVLEMAAEVLPDGDPHASWVELDGLDGRVLFLARGCSRAFEASQFSGFQEGVYFLDDTSFDVSLVLANGSNYPCRDIGWYSRGKVTRGVQGLPCEFQSDCSSPNWFYP